MELEVHLEHIRSSLYNDNFSTNSNSSQKTFEVIDWYLRLWSVYVLPLAIFLGVLNNTLILVVMPRSLVCVPRRVKRYYMWVALFDLLTVVMNDLLFSYFEDGLYFTTGGRFVIRTRSLGTWACKTLTIALKAATFFASYFFVFLTLERTFAVCVPLVAKRLFATHLSHFAAPTAISSAILAVQAIFSLLMDDVMWLPRGQNLCFRHPVLGDFLYQLYIWYACTVQYFLHPVVLLVCSVLICIKLLRQTETQKLFAAKSSVIIPPEGTLRKKLSHSASSIKGFTNGPAQAKIRSSMSVQFSYLRPNCSSSAHGSSEMSSLSPPEMVKSEAVVRVLREEGLVPAAAVATVALTQVTAAVSAITLPSPPSLQTSRSPGPSRTNSQLQHRGPGSPPERPLLRARRSRVTRELRASLTVVTLALMQCAAYLPCGLVCMFMCVALASKNVQHEQPEYFANLFVSFIFIETFFTMAHVWNLYIYIIKVCVRTWLNICSSKSTSTFPSWLQIREFLKKSLRISERIHMRWRPPPPMPG